MLRNCNVLKAFHLWMGKNEICLFFLHLGVNSESQYLYKVSILYFVIFRENLISMSTIGHTKCTSSLKTFSITFLSMSATYKLQHCLHMTLITFSAMRDRRRGTFEELKDWSSKNDVMLHF